MELQCPWSSPALRLTVHTRFSLTLGSLGCAAGIPGCGGDLFGEEGTLSTPTHMQRYHHNMDCEWRIRVPAGERVTLSFDHFELERSDNCIFDFVEVSALASG